MFVGGVFLGDTGQNAYGASTGLAFEGVREMVSDARFPATRQRLVWMVAKSIHFAPPSYQLPATSAAAGTAIARKAIA